MLVNAKEEGLVRPRQHMHTTGVGWITATLVYGIFIGRDFTTGRTICVKHLPTSRNLTNRADSHARISSVNSYNGGLTFQ